ncbi:P1 family peptidase [Nonomuraea typhae]|uniref:P1 family peptidase n=1 Tax=Nonomuraea typhae TaxID=2603600 RepID=A0ABW7YKA7_9ACTN
MTPRARDLGLAAGPYQPGRHNAITDVAGVRVGHTTVRREPGIHTGVSAVVPGRLPLSAGVYAGNGYGKLVGSTQVAELGVIETPILLTATMSAFRVADALISWMLARDPGLPSVNPVVGECNDGWLSDMPARPITAEHVFAALDGARSGPVEEGCVGAGTGTVALGFKAGIGTSSRTLTLHGAGTVTVGALVQANFGGALRTSAGTHAQPGASEMELLGLDDGSCMIVVATDARLDGRQLTRLAKRGVYALGRVGAAYSHGSGDYGLAFSTAGAGEHVADRHLSPLFAATLDAVEESVLNSLLAAVTTVGRAGHTAPAWRPV